MLAKGYGFIYDQLNRLTTSRYGEGTSYTSNVGRYDENLTFKYILTPEGRATYSSGAYTYEYFMKDHLGNTRISFNVPGSTAVIVQQSDYYPYGMTHRPQAVTTSDNRYLFNGKELQNNLLGGVNLDWYDYGARFYDPQLGRFTTIDPLAENGRRWSPYTYGADNPIRFIDPDGMWFDETNERKAERIVRRSERRGEKLDARAERFESKGKDATDLRARSAELRQMGQDVVDMGQSSTEFRFANANDKSNPIRDGNGIGLPVTIKTGDDQITMFMDNKNNFHEPRHGGQIARGEFTVDESGTPSSTYGASHEISAYRAQYAFTGKLNYIPAIDLNMQNLLLLGGQQGALVFQKTITNINLINPALLKVMVDQPGINQQYIYRNNPTEWWLK
ncbi:MAG: RHS repeat-associated core domain-containing protein [Bacteroidales bacterium]|jgi:RHS repeat-associated protein|nr:RHS repeat-associated core domain-containing protein [Bacteroidales bacterium]MDI9552748.1 RHS repeat-associated core domain-containing protein [Bacteroidota bacterium]